LRVAVRPDLDGRTAPELRDDLSQRYGAPVADVVRAGRGGLEGKPVGADHVADVGEVTSKAEIARSKVHGAVAVELGRGDLTRERGDDVGLLLSRAGMVEGTRPNDVQAMAVGVEAGEQIADLLTP
jgi:hypothetical protein